jgi:putative salt-induced outer membrane protein
MRRLWRLGIAGLALVWAAGAAGRAAATPLPPGVAAMIEAAAPDPAALKTVVALARKTNPNSGQEIDAQVAALTAKAAAQRTERLANLGFWQGWDGKGQIGMYAHSGNTEDGGVSVGLDLNRQGLRWRHIVNVVADYQQEKGATTKQKASAAYEGDRALGDGPFYAYGVLYAEHDRFAGIRLRTSEALGLGYWVIKRPTLKFNLEAGPAVRQTDYIDVADASTVDVRLAGEFAWTFRPGVIFTQSATAYLEHRNSTLASSTALSTKLFDAIAARASFDVTHEESPPPGREKTDTTSRLTLVYSF